MPPESPEWQEVNKCPSRGKWWQPQDLGCLAKAGSEEPGYVPLMKLWIPDKADRDLDSGELVKRRKEEGY